MDSFWQRGRVSPYNGGMTLEPSFVQALEPWQRWLWVAGVTLGYALVVWGGVVLGRYLEARDPS